jgi:F-box and leucine-rich repeat protein GRR1
MRQLKLNDCAQLEDSAVLAFALNCRNILEIDLHKCRQIGNDPITALLQYGRSLRELRLADCDLISDSAFTALPMNMTFEHLRILDLTSCARLTDRAVEKIVEVAPRLRNLVLAKCRNITDQAVHAISKLSKNLHYVHLGHCSHISDDAVIKLVQSCNRIRYIDLGCCVKLTDASVTKLAALPKLRRIGLVKCHLITDFSVEALSQANAVGHSISSLERVHLSYCTSLTMRVSPAVRAFWDTRLTTIQSILGLLNNCPRLTHLSLTGVHAFLRRDLEPFCRDAPPGKLI